MIEDPHQKIGRPRQLYTGATERDYIPISAPQVSPPNRRKTLIAPALRGDFL